MTAPVKVFYKGSMKDFIVFIEDEQIAEKYQKDSTIPLSDVVGTFKVFTTDQGGSEGVLDEASKQDLENEFGPLHVEEVIEKIIKQGTVKHSAKLDKKGWSSTNDSHGHNTGF